jgi:hypothetical protein
VGKGEQHIAMKCSQPGLALRIIGKMTTSDSESPRRPGLCVFHRAQSNGAAMMQGESTLLEGRGLDFVSGFGAK